MSRNMVDNSPENSGRKKDGGAVATVMAAIISTVGVIIAAWIANGVSTTVSTTTSREVAANVTKVSLAKRFASVHFDAGNAAGFKGTNVKAVIPNEPGSFTIVFDEAFHGSGYAAVASNTNGFVTLTKGSPEHITLINRDQDGNRSESGQLTLIAIQ